MHLPPRISNIIVWQFSQWLLDNDCLDVCMESTGKYRIPVFNILEDEINVVIANPKWVKAVKGKECNGVCTGISGTGFINNELGTKGNCCRGNDGRHFISTWNIRILREVRDYGHI